MEGCSESPTITTQIPREVVFYTLCIMPLSTTPDIQQQTKRGTKLFAILYSITHLLIRRWVWAIPRRMKNLPLLTRPCFLMKAAGHARNHSKDCVDREAILDACTVPGTADKAAAARTTSSIEIFVKTKW